MFLVIFTYFSLTFSSAQDNSVLKMQLVSYETLKSVPANVSIENGLVTSGNCVDMSANGDSISYSLRFDSVSGMFLCIPSRDQRSLMSTVTLDMGIPLNVENIRNSIDSYNLKIAQENNLSLKPEPVCSINTDGTIKENTCSCGDNTNLFIFDSNSKSCIPTHAEIVSFFVDNCSRSATDLEKFLKLSSVNMEIPVIQESDFIFLAILRLLNSATEVSA